MNRTLIAATAALATLAGTTSALAEITCQDLYEAAKARDLLPDDGSYMLTDPAGMVVCKFEAGGTNPEANYEGATGLPGALTNLPEAALFGITTAIDAQDGGVDGKALSEQVRRDQQVSQRAQQGSQRAQQGSQQAGNAGGRANAGGRP